jgi:glycosyltransferase involved in cell wall biosynthesis
VRLGVDAWNLPYDRRGIGRYTRALLGRFVREPGLEVVLLVPEWCLPAVAPRYRRMVPARVRNRRYARRCDVLWFPWNGLSWEPPAAVPVVATLHDASLFALAPDPALLAREEPPYRLAARRAAALLTDSEFSRGELVHYLGLDPQRLTAIHPGVEPPGPPGELPDLGLGPAEPFVLFVGEAEPRKGLATLGEALGRLGAAAPALVVAGRAGERAALPAQVRARILGHVDDPVLEALYRRAAALVYPSTYEGFGLPILEAMARGTPVITSDAASLPEVGGEAALYFAAGDVEALATAIARLLGDAALGADLAERGLRRAAEFTWERTAASTLAALRACAQAR